MKFIAGLRKLRTATVTLLILTMVCNSCAAAVLAAGPMTYGQRAEELSVQAYGSGTITPVSTADQLDAALNDPGSGYTIRLDADILDSQLRSIGKEITLDMNGHTLSLAEAWNVGTGGVLNLLGGGWIDAGERIYVYGGTLTSVALGPVIGGQGVAVRGGTATVAAVDAVVLDSGAAADASPGSLTVIGDVTVSGTGATAADASDGGSVTVQGNAVATAGDAARAMTGGTVEIGQDAIAANRAAIALGGVIIIQGNATTEGDYAAYIARSGSIQISGDANASAGKGIYAAAGCSITVGGDVTGGPGQTTAESDGGTLTIAGSVSGGGTGAHANIGSITVTGDVTGSNIGAYATSDGQVTIGGQLTAPAAKYVIIDGTQKSAADFEPVTTRPGYYTYRKPLSESVVWVKQPDHCTVNFSTDQGTPVASQTVPTGSKLDQAAIATTRTGFTFAGWYRTADCDPAGSWDLDNDLVTVNLTLHAKWVRNIYTVSFDTGEGGSAVASQQIGYNEPASRPETDPERGGYTFGGWFADAACEIAWDFEQPVLVDTTIYAKWIVNYQVTFDSRGGSPVASQLVPSGSRLSEATIATSKFGHHLLGWYWTEGSVDHQWLFDQHVVTGATNLFAKWQENEYTVTFEENGGTDVDDYAAVIHGSLISAPAIPTTKVGHTFDGWYVNEELTTPYDFDTLVQSSFTLYAKWRLNDYTVSYREPDGSLLLEETHAYDTVFNRPADPIKVGYTLAGWYRNQQLTVAYDFTQPLAGDLDLYALYKSSSKDILSFGIPGQTGATQIDPEAATVTVVMPWNTDFTSLVPVITVSEGSTISPASSVEADFSGPVGYQVTAQDGGHKYWTVTCIEDASPNNITLFAVANQVGAATIDPDARTVSFHMPYGTDISSLVPAVELTPRATYSVTVDGQAATPSDGLDFNGTVVYTVSSPKWGGGTDTKDWLATCVVDANTENNITEFVVAHQSRGSIIDAVSHQVTFFMPHGTDVTALIPAITLSDNASILPNPVSVDFTNPVTFTVKSASGADQDWVVTCVFESIENDITGFTVPGQHGATIIDEHNHTVTFRLYPGTAVNAIAPVITVSDGATINPPSEAVRDFHNVVTYLVTAQNGATQIWTASYRIYYPPQPETEPEPKQPDADQKLEETVAAVKVTAIEVSTGSATAIDSKSAVLSGTIVKGGGAELQTGFKYRAASDSAWSYTPVASSALSDGDSFTCTINGLRAGTTYQFEARAANSAGLGRGGISEFATAKAKAPKVLTYGSENGNLGAVILSGAVADDGGAAVMDAGFLWGDSSAGLTKHSLGATRDLSLELSDLKIGETYYYQAYAENSSGLAEGQLLTLIVPGLVVTTLEAVDITKDGATLQGKVSGSGQITEYGFTISPGSKGRLTTLPDAEGNFEVKIDQLEAGKKYYFGAYVRTVDKEILGEILEFTPDNLFPKLETYAAENIGQILATFGGYIVSNKGFPILDSGFSWGLDPNPDNLIIIEPAEDKRTLGFTLVGLKAATTYYYRAYATNEKGTGYGATQSFITREAVIPAITTDSALYDGSSGQWVLMGGIDHNGGTELFEYGFRISSDGKNWHDLVIGFDASGKYIARGLPFFNELQPGTYSLKAYAVNPAGTGEGGVITFTIPERPSVVTVLDLDTINQDRLTLIGRIEATGGAGALCQTTQFKVRRAGETEWLTVGLASGEYGVGDFSYQLTGLVPKAKYEFMAEAGNSYGSASGEILSFTMNYGKTAQEALAYLSKNDMTLGEIADVLKAEYQCSLAETVQLLLQAGYGLIETASTLQSSAYRATQSEIMSAVCDGKTAQEALAYLSKNSVALQGIADVLKAEYQCSLAETLQLLLQAGYELSEAESALQSSAYRATQSDIVIAMCAGKTVQEALAYLSENDIALQEIADVLRAEYQCSLAETLQLLLQAGYGLSETVSALKSSAYRAAHSTIVQALSSAEFATMDIAQQLVVNYRSELLNAGSGNIDWGLIRTMKQLQFSLAEAMEVMRSLYEYDAAKCVREFASGSLYTKTEVNQAAASVFGLDKLVGVLWANGVSWLNNSTVGWNNLGQVMREILAVLRDVGGLEPGEAAAKLVELHPQLDAKVVVDVFYYEGYTIGQSAAVLSRLYGSDPVYLAGILNRSIYSKNDIIACLIKDLGCPAVQLVQIITTVLTNVDPARTCASVLTNHYALDALGAAKVIYAAGWTEAGTANGFGLADLIYTIRHHLGQTSQSAVMTILRELGISPLEVAIRVNMTLWSLPEYRAVGYTAADAAAWVKWAYRTSGQHSQLGATVRYCAQAGYELVEIARALQSVFDIEMNAALKYFLDNTKETAEAINEALTSAYGSNPTLTAVVKLKDAGTAAVNIASTLRFTYGVEKPDTAAAYMLQADIDYQTVLQAIGRIYFDIRTAALFDVFRSFANRVVPEATYADILNAKIRIYGNEPSTAFVIYTLMDHQYDAGQIARILKDEYQVPLFDFMENFIFNYGTAHFSSVAPAVMQAYGMNLASYIEYERYRGTTAQKCATALATSFGVNTAGEVASILAKAGYSKEDVTQAVLEQFYYGDHSAEAVTELDQIIRVNFPVHIGDEIRSLLKHGQVKPVSSGCETLLQAGYQLEDLVIALKDIYILSSQEATDELIALNVYTSDDIEIAVQSVYGNAYVSMLIDYWRNHDQADAERVYSNLMREGGITDPVAAFRYMRAAGFSESECITVLYYTLRSDVYPVLETIYQDNYMVMYINFLKSRGQNTHEIYSDLVRTSGITDHAVLYNYLRAAGFSESDCLTVLYNTLRSRVYPVLETIFQDNYMVTYINFLRSRGESTLEIYDDLVGNSGISDKAVLYNYMRVAGLPESECVEALYRGRESGMGENLIRVLSKVYDLRDAVEVAAFLKPFADKEVISYYSARFADLLAVCYPGITDYQIVKALQAYGLPAYRFEGSDIEGWLRSYATNGLPDDQLAAYLGKNNGGLDLSVRTAVEVLHGKGYAMQDAVYWLVQCGYDWKDFYGDICYAYTPSGDAEVVVNYLKDYYDIKDIARGEFGFHGETCFVLHDLISGGFDLKEALYATLWVGGAAAGDMVVTLVDNSILRANAARDQSLRLNAITAADLVYDISLLVSCMKKLEGVVDAPIRLEDIALSLVQNGPARGESRYFSHWEVLAAMETITRKYLEVSGLDLPVRETALAALRMAGYSAQDAAETMAQYRVGLSTSSIIKGFFGLGSDWINAVYTLAGAGYSFGDSISAIIGNSSYKFVMTLGILSSITSSALGALSSSAQVAEYVNTLKDIVNVGFMIGEGKPVDEILVYALNAKYLRVVDIKGIKINLVMYKGYQIYKASGGYVPAPAR